MAAMRRRCVALLLLGACAVPSAPPPSPAPPSPDRRREALDVLQALETGFDDHWGSFESTAAFRRLTDDHVPHLRDIAGANGPFALTALRALDRLVPDAGFSSSARAHIYAGALGRETNFARWGAVGPSGFLPGVYGAELMKLGKTATDPLRPLLADRRRAPIRAGRAEEAANRLQGDRICDYAWIFLATIHDRPLAYFTDPAQRDEEIRRFDLWLDRR